MQEEVDNNSNNIYIFWNSSYAEYDKEEFEYQKNWNNEIKNLLKSKNFLIFAAWWNINKENWILKNQILHENVNGDEHWQYSLPSITNWKSDSEIDKHLIVTIWTNKNWDINQTNEIYESSKFPVWFHPDVLFAWRTFPNQSTSWRIEAESWRYATSLVNYTNVAVADLCFQMFAEVKDVDELLDMIRNSSELRDYIRFDLNGDGDTDDTIDGQPETQPLILMNPAGFFLKYLMPFDLPTTISISKTVALGKGYYHGLAFDIPGAEVKINDEWISFCAENKDLILVQNPFALEWRLNGDLLRQFGYKQGDNLKGKVIAVDDQWNGLNLSQDISITVSSSDAINAPNVETAPDAKLFNLNGLRVGKGYKGIVISNGRKAIIK